MKKIQFSVFAMMILALVCGFTSCGSDDDDNNGGSSSYNLTDEEAVTALQGTWSVKVTEYDEEEGDDNWIETWVVQGNNLTTTEDNYTYKSIFTIKNGIIAFGDPVYFDRNNEKHRFNKLTSNYFETSDAEFNNGKICIKMVGTKK